MRYAFPGSPWAFRELGCPVISGSRYRRGDLSGGPAKRPGLNIGERTPLIVNGFQLIPTGTNRFTKSDTAFIYGEIFEPSPAPLSIQMVLLDAKTGKPEKGTGMTPLNEQIEPDNAIIPVGLLIPLAELEPGSYTARIKALDATGRESTASISFEVN